MTKEQVIEKTKQLIEQSNNKMLENFEKLLNNGHIDYENAEDNFILPRIILCALLKEESFQYKPIDKKHTNEVNKLYLTIG